MDIQELCSPPPCGVVGVWYCVNIYICKHVCVCVYIYTCIFICMNIYIYTYFYVFICLC